MRHDRRMVQTTSTLDSPPDDPVYLNSLREFFLILGMWAFFLVWVVSYCYFYGYRPVGSPDELPMTLGMPSWVVWGIAVPWLVANLLTIAMCIWGIKDDDLEPHAPTVAD